MSEIFFYNTLRRKKEQFVSTHKGVVSMYHCGPTVYDYAHIGNVRSFVMADILRRMFEYNTYEVRQVMNITDVDDKTIKRAQEEKISLSELIERFIGFFLKDIDTLHIDRPLIIARATEHIEDMIVLIEKLLQNGFAYKGEDGSIYFKIEKFPSYGALAGIGDVKLREGARVSSDEYTKDNVNDFALWKAWSDEDGDVYWETPLGKGRPGWHIECSAMSMKYLGESFDIHTGGRDLIFPHHTNEIAQSESSTGKPFVNFWLHNEFITVEGKKMSKSDGNIFTLEDIKKKNILPIAYRYWLLQAHYRTLVNFTWEALEGAENALKKLYEHYRDLGESTGDVHPEYKDAFVKAINNDLDTPRALALVWELLKDQTIDSDRKKATLLSFDEVLGLGLDSIVIQPIPLEVLDLVSKRDKARKNKDWKEADGLRREIEALEYAVKDTEDGTQITKK